jgi:hypothetical protein
MEVIRDIDESGMRRKVHGTAPYRTILYHATESVRAHQPCRDERHEEASIYRYTVYYVLYIAISEFN